GDETGGRESFNRGAEFALFLTIPAAVALMVIALPIITVLFQRGAFTAADSQETAVALAVYSLGLPAFVLHKVLQPLYYAREDTRRPFNFAVLSMVVNAVAAFGLAPVFGYLAAAVGTTLSSWMMVAQLWRGTRRMGASARIDARFRQRVPLILLSAAVMGLVLWALAWAMGDALYARGTRTPALAALVLLGAATYFATAALTGAMGLAELRAFLRRGRKSGG
ncbi:MAG: lipid II flippase MurJ, partial [Paracoccaceae bacterium]